MQVDSTVAAVWKQLDLPVESLSALQLEDADDVGLPSSYKIGHISVAAISLSALTASLIRSTRLGEPSSDLATVTVNPHHALAAFLSERLVTLNNETLPPVWGPIAGLYETKDGHVRIHDVYEHHRAVPPRVFGCTVDKQELAGKLKDWGKVQVEDMVLENGGASYALRSPAEWKDCPQAKHISNVPIHLVPHLPDTAPLDRRQTKSWAGIAPTVVASRPLAGIRVLDLTRVIAGPVAGRTLAAYGADVIWVSSPLLPSSRELDTDMQRGKRALHLDLNTEGGRDQLRELVKGADVFLQSYRPGSIANRGFGWDEVRRVNPDIIYASLSAWGTEGPWSTRRGFDSLVQTATGIQASEALTSGASDPAKPLPCQALDHASGYLLATGIMAALYKRMNVGGSYRVDVSLAGAGKWLSSMGRVGKEGFDHAYPTMTEVKQFMDLSESEEGTVAGVRQAGEIQGVDVMLEALTSHKPRLDWL